MWLEFLLLSTLALWLFYRWATANYDFFEKRGIAYHKPYPLIGCSKELMLRKCSMFDLFCNLYNMHKGRVFGVFDQRKPIFLLRDPDLLKQITIKEFDHFVNHRPVFRDDGLFGSSLFFMQNEKWKDMRTTLSPAFTGSKMRQMFELTNQVAQDTAAYLLKEIEPYGQEGLELDLKDVCTRCTNDVIASAAFGLQVNSFKNRENKFYMMGKIVTTFTGWQNLKFFLYANFKPLIKFFRIEIFDKKYLDYFTQLVLDAMKYRKEHNIFRPDMINLLMEARGMIKSDHPKTHNRDWSDAEIVGQCFGFFFAGFDTTAVLMCFAAHELMENLDVQQKLFEEIQSVCSDLDGKPLTYEALQGLKYMDMVISEVLRKWPAAPIVDRLCNKDFAFDDYDGKRVVIKEGDGVWIPICGFHRDPKFYENPDKFHPERFSDENKDKIVPGTYLPFGLGPRNCIGSRFALLEAKAVIFYMLRDFRIEASKKSTIPMELSTKTFQLTPKTGFWLKLIPRNKGQSS